MNLKKIPLFILVSALCSWPICSWPIAAAGFVPPAAVLSTAQSAIAQAFLDERCPDQYVYVLGETANFRVVICGDRTTGFPTHYLGVSKQNGSRILLPLSAYTNDRFFARNGGYTYTLDLSRQTLRIGIPGIPPQVEAFTPETP